MIEYLRVLPFFLVSRFSLLKKEWYWLNADVLAVFNREFVCTLLSPLALGLALSIIAFTPRLENGIREEFRVYLHLKLAPNDHSSRLLALGYD